MRSLLDVVSYPVVCNIFFDLFFRFGLFNFASMFDSLDTSDLFSFYVNNDPKRIGGLYSTNGISK